jgi:hypothetical protein
MRSLPKISKINKQGVQKLSREIISLQQNFASLTGYPEPMFERVRNYYHMLAAESTTVRTEEEEVEMSAGWVGEGMETKQ